MKRSLTFLVLLTALAAPAQDGSVSLNGDRTKVTVTFEAAPNRGERVYKTYCHHCHGENGDGTGHIGKGLVIKPVDLTAPDGAARFTTQNIAHVVREGSGKPGAAMIPWKTVLPEEAIKDVAAYTADLAARGRAKRLGK